MAINSYEIQKQWSGWESEEIWDDYKRYMYVYGGDIFRAVKRTPSNNDFDVKTIWSLHVPRIELRTDQSSVTLSTPFAFLNRRDEEEYRFVNFLIFGFGISFERKKAYEDYEDYSDYDGDDIVGHRG